MTEKDLLSIYDAMRPLLDREIDSRTQSALRMKSMVVTTAYDSGTETVGVTEAFGNEMQLPVFGGLDTTLLVKGVPVWVMMPYGSMSNAVVFTLGDMTGLGGGGGGGNTTYTFATGTTNGTFDVTPSDTGVVQSVPIYGLGSAAYTSSSDYATSGHGHSNATTSTAGFESAADKTKLDAIGWYSSASGSPTVSSASNATLCSITLPANGVYVIEATCRFANNNTGRRGLRIDTSASSAESATQHTTVVPAASGYTIVNTAAVISGSGTVYARVYQNSGSNLSTSGYMYITRIK